MKHVEALFKHSSNISQSPSSILSSPLIILYAHIGSAFKHLKRTLQKPISAPNKLLAHVAYLETLFNHSCVVFNTM